MSLDLINHKLTTSTTDENGVITWSNPAVDVKINSKGQVFKYGEIYKGNTNSSRNGVCYYSINYQCNPKKQATIPFSSLYSRMVLGVKLGTKTIKLKDKSKGYLISNTDVVKVICNRKTGKTVDYINNSVLPKELKTKESTTLVNTQQGLIDTQEGGKVVLDLSKLSKEYATHYNNVNNQLYLNRGNCWFYYSEASAEWCKSGNKEAWILETTQPIGKKAEPKQTTLTVNTPKIEMKPNSNKQYYTLYEAKNEHTTEDGAVFPTKELAEWHQTKVTKGKGNAQVVLDYNGGYVLAEQIYLQEVVYNKAKPYTNFIDVLNNNQGIVSVVQEEHCKFDKPDNEHGLSPVQLNLFGLDKVINLPCTKLQAEKINTSLNKYSEAFSKLEDEHKTLKDLLKQVS